MLGLRVTVETYVIVTTFLLLLIEPFRNDVPYFISLIVIYFLVIAPVCFVLLHFFT